MIKKKKMLPSKGEKENIIHKKDNKTSNPQIKSFWGFRENNDDSFCVFIMENKGLLKKNDIPPQNLFDISKGSSEMPKNLRIYFPLKLKYSLQNNGIITKAKMMMQKENKKIWGFIEFDDGALSFFIFNNPGFWSETIFNTKNFDFSFFFEKNRLDDRRFFEMNLTKNQNDFSIKIEENQQKILDFRMKKENIPLCPKQENFSEDIKNQEEKILDKEMKKVNCSPNDIFYNPEEKWWVPDQNIKEKTSIEQKKNIKKSHPVSPNGKIKENHKNMGNEKTEKITSDTQQEEIGNFTSLGLSKKVSEIKKK